MGPGSPGPPVAINGARLLIARMDLKASSVTAIPLGVGQKKFEAIPTAAGTGGLDETFGWGLFGGVGHQRWVVGLGVVWVRIRVVWGSMMGRGMVDWNNGWSISGIWAVMGVGSVGGVVSKRVVNCKNKKK